MRKELNSFWLKDFNFKFKCHMTLRLATELEYFIRGIEAQICREAIDLCSDAVMKTRIEKPPKKGTDEYQRWLGYNKACQNMSETFKLFVETIGGEGDGENKQQAEGKNWRSVNTR
jgi:hypothetical protein